ncbi:unnamed protein product [Urochloa humidicola]
MVLGQLKPVAMAMLDLNAPPVLEVDEWLEEEEGHVLVEEEEQADGHVEEVEEALEEEQQADVLDLNVEPLMDEDLAGLDADLQQLHGANELNADEVDDDLTQLHGANEDNAEELDAQELDEHFHQHEDELEQGGSEYLCFMLFNLCCS